MQKFPTRTKSFIDVNPCVYAQRESHRKNIRVRESRDTCATSLLGALFFFFFPFGFEM